MSRAKVFISILTVLILTVLSGASVWAAPGGQDGEFTDIIGVVDSIELVPGFDPETEDPITIVRVNLTDEFEEPLTVDLYLAGAAKLGLLMGAKIGENVEIPDPADPNSTISGKVKSIVIDADGLVLVTLILVDGTEPEFSLSLDEAAELGLLAADNDSWVGETLTIDDPTYVIPEEDGAEVEHPVALALMAYFGEDLDIMGVHEDGFGFGLIAQACWMSVLLGGEFTFDEILYAKKDHALGDLTLPGGKTASNWGQFKKAVTASEEAQKNLNNLGAIMSKRAPSLEGTDNGDDEGELETTSTQGKVKGKKDKAGGKPKIPPGQVKKSGKPDTSPGKGKNKDKDKGGGKKN